MKVQKVYFDGGNKGKIIAVAEDGSSFEQSHEECPGCGGVAKVFKPIGGVAPARKKCGCNH